MNSKLLRLIAGSLVLIALIVGVVMIINNRGKGNNDSATKVPAITVEELRKKIKFTDTRARNVEGKYKVTGAAVNQDAHTRSFKVKATFVDKDRQVISKVYGEIIDLKAGESRAYELVSETPFVPFDVYVVEVDEVI